MTQLARRCEAAVFDLGKHCDAAIERGTDPARGGLARRPNGLAVASLVDQCFENIPADERTPVKVLLYPDAGHDEESVSAAAARYRFEFGVVYGGGKGRPPATTGYRVRLT